MHSFQIIVRAAVIGYGRRLATTQQGSSEGSITATPNSTQATVNQPTTGCNGWGL